MNRLTALRFSASKSDFTLIGFDAATGLDIITGA